MKDLTGLPNIGPRLAERLKKIGITNLEALAELGSIEAVLKLEEKDLSACYNMLYALEGAIQGIRWHNLPKEERALLKAELDELLAKHSE